VKREADRPQARWGSLSAWFCFCPCCCSTSPALRTRRLPLPTRTCRQGSTSLSEVARVSAAVWLLLCSLPIPSELAIPSSSPSPLLGLCMVHPSRDLSVIVRSAARRTGGEAVVHRATSVTRPPCRSRRKAKGWRRCWARELKAENYFFQFDEGAALDHRFRKFPRL
jgi:hypothetical protein